MKIIQVTFTLSITLLFISCQTNVKPKYHWIHKTKTCDDGNLTLNILHENSKQIYRYMDSPVIGVSHQFMNGDNTLFSISDGTGKDVLGSGVSVYSGVKNNVDLLDLDMDGDIDFAAYGDLRFGRFADNKFAPLPDRIILNNYSNPSVLEYLNSNTSEQVVAPDGE